MSKQYKLVKSRGNWKKKASDRAAENRYLRQELARIKNERNKFKEKLNKLEERLKIVKNETSAVSEKINVVFISLQLFLVARIGFRAVSRVLSVLGGYLGLMKTPCPQTIINWVDRLSIARIQNVKSIVASQVSSSGLIFMIDTTSALGVGRILCVLGLAADHYGTKREAPCLQDVHCLGIGVAASWTGETIADFILKVINEVGNPVAYLKDGGTDIAKAVRILAQQGCSSFFIRDISHVIANLLKHAYEKHPLLEIFLSACGKVSQKLKQTILACLAPPKVSTRTRFMNLHRLVLWADRLLKHSPVGRAARGSLLEKLRNSLEQLPDCKSFIVRFLRDASTLLNCQKILKNSGLSDETAVECKSLLSAIPSSSSVYIGFTNWMDAQLEIAEKLSLSYTGLPITSDSIESLFGVAKVHGVGEVEDAYRIAGRIPTMCGRLTEKDAQGVLDISVSEQKRIMGNLPSLIRQRRDLLVKHEKLDDVLSEQTQHSFELVPGG